MGGTFFGDGGDTGGFREEGGRGGEDELRGERRAVDATAKGVTVRFVYYSS